MSISLSFPGQGKPLTLQNNLKIIQGSKPENFKTIRYSYKKVFFDVEGQGVSSFALPRSMLRVGLLGQSKVLDRNKFSVMCLWVDVKGRGPSTCTKLSGVN